MKYDKLMEQLKLLMEERDNAIVQYAINEGMMLLSLLCTSLNHKHACTHTHTHTHTQSMNY